MSKEANILVGGGQYVDKSESAGASRFCLSIYPLGNEPLRLVSLTFLPHGVARDPLDLNRIVTCEKIGPGAAVIDLSRGECTHTIDGPEARLFYGHCEFSRDGAVLYTTETYKDSHDGAIIIRDARSFEIIGEFPSFGSSPHECQIIDDGKTMVITNGGGPSSGAAPNVAYIDIESRRLIRKEELTNRALNTGHFVIAGDGSLVVVSAPRTGLASTRPGGVSIQPANKRLRSLTRPKKVVSGMTGEALSTCIHGTTAAVTHPDGNMVTFWSIENRNFIQRLELPKPRGVVLTKDSSRFVISFGHDASLLQIEARTLQPLNSTLRRGTYLTGSHIYNIG